MRLNDDERAATCLHKHFTVFAGVSNIRANSLSLEILQLVTYWLLYYSYYVPASQQSSIHSPSRQIPSSRQVTDATSSLEYSLLFFSYSGELPPTHSLSHKIKTRNSEHMREGAEEVEAFLLAVGATSFRNAEQCIGGTFWRNAKSDRDVALTEIDGEKPSSSHYPASKCCNELVQEGIPKLK